MNSFQIFCFLVGFLWLLDWLAYQPMFSAFFGNIEKNDYRPGNRLATLILNLAWPSAALALMTGSAYARLTATVFFYVLYRHYYIDTRWSSIRRGGGAPGFMSHWTAFYLLLLQFAAFLDGRGWLSSQVWWMMQVDFAVIMICAGTYKYMVGYLHHDGMEYGRVNPLWGYHWRRFVEGNPRSLYVRFCNFMAVATEFTAGVAMLIPGQKLWGAIAISASFVYVALYIRLGRLAWLMAVLPLLYLGSFGTDLLATIPYHLDLPGFFVAPLGWLTWAFVAALPVVKFTQYYNLFANRSLPQPWQARISAYANRVPIIIWRVFTPDVTNFYLRIYEERDGLSLPLMDEETFSLKNWSQAWLKLRFLHVTEAIAIVSVFTTLKYFPSQREMFDDKLRRYSLSLQHALGRPLQRLRYEYISIHKTEERFLFVHVGNFRVDFEDQLRVSEEKLIEEFDFSAPSKYSPVRESAGVGTFTPK